jgi:predicted transcriptional regulator
MSWIRRSWKAEEADDWTREDLIASILSVLSYITLAVGVALSLLLQVIGFIILAAAIIFIVLMIYVIDPKLKAISSDYEKKQKEYMEDLEKIERWEE